MATRAFGQTRRIRALRPPRRPVDPWATPPWLVEQERAIGGGTETALTLFLRGAECPFTCVYCDLWRDTLPEKTPRGALPAQIDRALEEATARGTELDRVARIKLYNASNFFEERAVPREDEEAILARVGRFPELTVECHPRLVTERCSAFADRFPGRLEVAMGLETAHPQALARMNKGMDLEGFARAAAALAEREISLRAFVLVGAPFVPPSESVAWAVRSVEHALGHGVRRTALIPVRGGNGEMERLRAQGDFHPPTLGQLEEALCLALDAAGDRGIVTADLWDFDLLARCATCAPARRRRLERMNLEGKIEPPVACASCGAAAH